MAGGLLQFKTHLRKIPTPHLHWAMQCGGPSTPDRSLSIAPTSCVLKNCKKGWATGLCADSTAVRTCVLVTYLFGFNTRQRNDLMFRKVAATLSPSRGTGRGLIPLVNSQEFLNLLITTIINSCAVRQRL